MRVVIAGCGAVGSQVAWHIADEDTEFVLIDNDRVEQANVVSGTSMYSSHHIGMLKAMALAEILWGKAGMRSVHTVTGRATVSSDISKWATEQFLVIDSFDNVASRKLTSGMNTLHVGVSEGGVGVAIWDERYEWYDSGDGENPICTHQLGRGIIRLTSVVAAHVVDAYMSTGGKIDVVVTDEMEVCVR